ncbi:FAD binding domain-containing protein [Bradyrhizobium sp. CCBAU 45389]|uniref:FAD binding domain-containing protein n=1 Tax=Bradyrhizobium sp. CCBAU 45389 TaxID=858429 RepID=UPI00230515A4|nr:FAD binding domain-containing protein [Bradyrhizobium sp. CCBAU 45389]MDA9397579.1 FAD-binding molybdopterin dehydrogenase [Bradyrhizobium sp. CCBAU 45389]
MTTCTPAQGNATGTFHIASSLAAALDALNDYGPEGAAFAGGTWIMRAPIRHQPLKGCYVAIGKIPELTEIRIGPDAIEIGAAVTHAALASALADLPEFAVLTAAAGRSANPAVRAMATIGGNLATSDFSAADCVPALLCLDAQIEVSSRSGHERMSLEAFLTQRSALAPGRLLTKIVVPRSRHKTAHARLTLRKAGDYPVAIVSLSLDVDATNHVRAARIAIGSVETVARRWERLETALLDRLLDPSRAADMAADLADEFAGRDSVEAPPWYRVSVLPGLVRRATATALGA